MGTVSIVEGQFSQSDKILWLCQQRACFFLKHPETVETRTPRWSVSRLIHGIIIFPQSEFIGALGKGPTNNYPSLVPKKRPRLESNKSLYNHPENRTQEWNPYALFPSTVIKRKDGHGEAENWWGMEWGVGSGTG